MSDRKPKIGEVWTGGPEQGWECLKHVGDDRYIWHALFGKGAVVVCAADGLTPPTTPPPSWLDDDTWLHFEMCHDEGLRLFADDLYDGDYNPPPSVAKIKLDPSTFEWLDGR